MKRAVFRSLLSLAGIFLSPHISFAAREPDLPTFSVNGISCHTRRSYANHMEWVTVDCEIPVTGAPPRHCSTRYTADRTGESSLNLSVQQYRVESGWRLSHVYEFRPFYPFEPGPDQLGSLQPVLDAFCKLSDADLAQKEAEEKARIDAVRARIARAWNVGVENGKVAAQTVNARSNLPFRWLACFFDQKLSLSAAGASAQAAAECARAAEDYPDRAFAKAVSKICVRWVDAYCSGNLQSMRMSLRGDFGIPMYR